MVVTLTGVDMATGALGEEVAGVSVSDGWAWLTAPRPPDDGFVEIDPASLPGTMLAFHIVGLHIDRDGNSTHDDGEGYVGSSPVLAVYVDGEFPAGLENAGWKKGWNAFEFSSDGAMTIHDTDAIPVDAGLWPEDELAIAGTYVGPVPDAPMGMLLSPVQFFEGSPLASPFQFHDNPYDGGPWSIEVEEAPPADHLYPWSPEWYSFAQEIVLVYADEDESGSLSGGDSPVSTLCLDGVMVVALYMPPPEDVMSAYQFQSTDFQSGWAVGYTAADEWVRLTDGERASLLLDDDCL